MKIDQPRSTLYGIHLFMIGFWFITILGFLYIPGMVQRWIDRTSLNILIWPTMLDAQKLRAFEKETGVKLHVTYYESNEELIRKIMLTRGQGYDLIIAADSAVHELAQAGLLAPLDVSKLSFFSKLRPSLLNHYYDPDNRYAIPYYLGVYGIGIDADYFKGRLPTPSWDLIFKPQGFKISMTDDPRRAVLLAGLYLFGSIDQLNEPKRLAAIKNLLIQQKKWVELYSDVRGEELLASKSCPVALTISSDVWRIKQEYQHVQFLIPEKSFMVIDSFVIPKTTEKSALVYQLLNFIYQPELLAYHARKYGFCPPRADVELPGSSIICPDAEQMTRLNFFRNTLPKERIDAVWVSVMAD